jgi:hypothetical protein
MAVSHAVAVFVSSAVVAMAQSPPPDIVSSKDGTSIAYRKAGSRPPMLLVHGSASIGLSWAPVLPQLSKHLKAPALFVEKVLEAAK